jgi:Flp pilus assembly protein TadB
VRLCHDRGNVKRRLGLARVRREGVEDTDKNAGPALDRRFRFRLIFIVFVVFVAFVAFVAFIVFITFFTFIAFIVFIVPVSALASVPVPAFLAGTGIP